MQHACGWRVRPCTKKCAQKNRPSAVAPANIQALVLSKREAHTRTKLRRTQRTLDVFAMAHNTVAFHPDGGGGGVCVRTEYT